VSLLHSRTHTKLAVRKGANEQEIMEAIWVVAEMRAGGAYAHSALGHRHYGRTPARLSMSKKLPARARRTPPAPRL
jgi:hypothetical protein